MQIPLGVPCGCQMSQLQDQPIGVESSRFAFWRFRMASIAGRRVANGVWTGRQVPADRVGIEGPKGARF